MAVTQNQNQKGKANVTERKEMTTTNNVLCAVLLYIIESYQQLRGLSLLVLGCIILGGGWLHHIVTYTGYVCAVV
jgi:hypothetical protein